MRQAINLVAEHNGDMPLHQVAYPLVKKQPIGPPRKITKILTFFGFFPAHTKKWAQMGPNGPKWFFFLLIQTLLTFWAERIWILRISCSITYQLPVCRYQPSRSSLTRDIEECEAAATNKLDRLHSRLASAGICCKAMGASHQGHGSR